MAPTQAPYPYYDAYTDHLEPVRIEGQQPVYQNDGSLPALTEGTAAGWRYLDPKLDEIIADVEQNGLNAAFTTPSRLEFTWNSFMTGVLIFDSRGQLIVHSPDSLLGYDGYGPELSDNIMHRLGVPRAMVVDIHREARDSQPYQLVVSREKLVILDGVVTAVRGLDYSDEWMWWRKR